jgi:hypothetical protein
MPDEIVQNTSTEQTGNPTLAEAITNAETSVSQEAPPQGTESQETEPSGTKPTSGKDDSAKQSDLTALEIEQAAQIFRTLKDPERAPALIDYIAKQAGYDKIETKQEVAQAKDAVLEILEGELGSEFSFLTPKLSNAISKILEHKLIEHTQDIRETIQQDRESKIRVETTASFTDLSKQYFGKDTMPPEILAEMAKAMEVYPPAQNMSVKDYLKDMLHTASSRLNYDLKNSSRHASSKNIIDRNRNDAVSRLASDRGASDGNVVGATQNRKMSLEEAIQKAEQDYNLADK